MSTADRQMHLGVFVLGTGNHSAGWRYDGAAISNLDLSVTQEIARIAERGKFDLLFISDGLVMDPGDHPSFLCRFEPTTLSRSWLPRPGMSGLAPRSRPVLASPIMLPAPLPRLTTSATAVPRGTWLPARLLKRR